MPKWSKTKEIKLSENERIAILRKAKFHYKNWDEAHLLHLDQKTIDGLRDFEKEEEIQFDYDKKDNKISIRYVSGYPNKLALK